MCSSSKRWGGFHPWSIQSSNLVSSCSWPRTPTSTDTREGKVDTLRLVVATITIVYITSTQMRVMGRCGAHHAPFLPDPQWPARHIFQAYLRTCATKAGHTMPGPKDIDTAYKTFERQHPRPRPNEHEAPIDGGTKKEEPTQSPEGWTPATILLLAVNGHKHATCTVHRHHTPRSVPKHNAPETDVPPLRRTDQGIPCTCWHCSPAAPDSPWPLLHLSSTHYHTPTAAATADQQAWLSPWFHTVPPGHPAHVAWTRTAVAAWTFTRERADPESVAIEYNRCDPYRAGPHQAPMRPLQHKCPDLRGDKEGKERRQTITCQRFRPGTGYLFHLMYAYITQGLPDRGLLRLSPRGKAIITQELGVYGTPLLQPTQTSTRNAIGNPVYIYHPTAIARIPVPSDNDIIYFLTHPAPSSAPARSVVPPRASPGARTPFKRSTTPGRPSSGLPATGSCAPWRTPSPPHHHPQQSVPATSWYSRRTRSTSTSSSALRTCPSTRSSNPASPHNCWGCGWPSEACTPKTHCKSSNRSADTHGKHQNTNHIPGLEHLRLDTQHHSHLQHLLRIPSATQPPHWIPEDTLYTD